MDYGEWIYAVCNTEGNQYGFTRTCDAIACTEHYAWDIHYIKDLA